MKIIELIVAFFVSCLIFFIIYFFGFIAPQLQDEIIISNTHLKILLEYKAKHPELIGPLCEKALSDGEITRKEYSEIAKAFEDHEESLLYKKLIE